MAVEERTHSLNRIPSYFENKFNYTQPTQKGKAVLMD